MGSRHCTRAYTETVDPARRPSIPQVRQGSVRFNSSEEEPPPSPFPFLLYTYSMVVSNVKTDPENLVICAPVHCVQSVPRAPKMTETRQAFGIENLAGEKRKSLIAH